jgi:hypothetical protein
MGTSACTYHIRNCTQARCLEALARVKSPRAFVSSAQEEWLSIADEDCDAFQLESLEQGVAALSKQLSADAIITAVYDDDMSMYVAFHRGSEADRYSTTTVPWKGKRKFSGNPKRLSEAFTWWNQYPQLEAVLKKKFSLEGLRLRKIGLAFGIPERRAFTTFGDLASPLAPEIVASFSSPSEMERLIGDRSSYAEFMPVQR